MVCEVIRRNSNQELIYEFILLILGLLLIPSVLVNFSIIITKMYIVQKVHRKMKNRNTHAMKELGLIGTHELYHKINVFTVKTI